MINTRFSVLLLILVVLIALLGIRLATHWGINVNPDSASYLSASRNLSDGKGLTTSFLSGDPSPLTWYAPLYSVILSGVSSIFGEPAVAAVSLNMALMAISIFLVALAIYESTRNIYATLAGAFLVVSAPEVNFHYSSALSEPPFLVFCLLTWLLLSRYLQHNRMIMLILAALLALLAFLVRYSGAGLVGASALAILLLSRQPFGRRVLHTLIFGLISTLPVLIWLAFCANASNGIGQRSFAFHPIPLRKLVLGGFTIARWILPEDVIRSGIESGNWVALLAIGLALSALSILLIKVMRHYGLVNITVIWHSLSNMHPLPALLSIFVIGYIAFMMFSISFIDAYSYLEERLLLPAHMATMIVITYVMYRVIWNLSPRSTLRTALVIASSVFILSYNIQTATQIRSLYIAGFDYTSSVWRDSETINFVTTLVPNTTIYTNNPEAIYLIVGRSTSRVPEIYDVASLKPNTNLDNDIKAMEAVLRESGGYVIMFNCNTRQHQITEDELKNRIPLKAVITYADATVYQIAL